MAKKKIHHEHEDALGTYSSNIQDVTINEYIKQIVLKYGMNVSVFRISPAFKDGLTPVSRRSIYAMYKLGVTYNQPRKKASKLLGEVAGYHPHGNLSIEKAFINEIKAYETNAGLYDVHGNTGSATGQKAAAVRYLDARLSRFATYCFFHPDDYYEDLLDMTETYTRDAMEPVTLASRYPYFLLTNTTGVGWGSSFSSVPYNLEEVFRLTQALLRNPEMTGVYLYPDSPRGYDIIESDDILDICEQGMGTLKIQARIEYVEAPLDKNGKLPKDGRYLVVTGLPEQTVMDKLTEQISKMIMNKTIDGITTWRDKSYIRDDGTEHIEFWLILDSGADENFIIDMLYKKTQLRHYLSLNFNYAARTSMKHLGIKDSLLLWIDNRLSYKTKVFAKKVYKLKETIHVLEGITNMLSIDNIDRTVSIVKSAEDRASANMALMKEYNVTSYQANCITNMRITDITRKARSGATEKLEQVRKDLVIANSIMGDSEKIKDIIYEELEEGIKLFGKPRACRVISQEALEPPKYQFNIAVTKKYIKKLSVNNTNVGTLGSDDEVVAFFTNVPEDRALYIIDDLGKTYYIKLSKLKPSSLTSKGTELMSTFGIKGTPIRAFMNTPNVQTDDINIVMFTESGIIKQSKLSSYVTNRTELQGIVLNKDDKVCHTIIYDNEDYQASPFVLIYTEQGMGIALDLQSIPVTDRMTKGSRFLNLEDGDVVKGVCGTNVDKLFVLTNKGYGKVCELDDIFKTSKRRAAMIKLTGLSEDDKVFKILPYTSNRGKYGCLLQSGTRVDIDKKDIQVTTRVSKGKKLVPVKRGDSIIKVKEL